MRPGTLDFWASVRGVRFEAADPQRRLCLAILSQAIEDLVVRQDSVAREKARRWLFSESARPWTFRWVCTMIGTDTERIRRFVTAAESGAASEDSDVS